MSRNRREAAEQTSSHFHYTPQSPLAAERGYDYTLDDMRVRCEGSSHDSLRNSRVFFTSVRTVCIMIVNKFCNPRHRQAHANRLIMTPLIESLQFRFPKVI